MYLFVRIHAKYNLHRCGGKFVNTRYIAIYVAIYSVIKTPPPPPGYIHETCSFYLLSECTMVHIMTIIKQCSHVSVFEALFEQHHYFNILHNNSSFQLACSKTYNFATHLLSVINYPLHIKTYINNIIAHSIHAHYN